MQKAIGYLRVSTRGQGCSGLGLAAQRHDIEALVRAKALRSNLGTRTCRLARERWLAWADRIQDAESRELVGRFTRGRGTAQKKRERTHIDN